LLPLPRGRDFFPRKYNLGKREVKHEFLYLPDCPGDLCKLRAQITFDPDGTAALKLRGPEAKVLTLMVVQEEEWQLYASKKEFPELPYKIPGVWTEDNLRGLAQNISRVVVELKLGGTPVSQKQYYIPHKAQVGIQNHLDRLLKYGILWPCQSPWNTPLLPAQKPGTKDFRPVQDLFVVNNCYSTPCGPKPLQALWPYPSCSKVLYLLGP
jgi:hypothetical protein